MLCFFSRNPSEVPSLLPDAIISCQLGSTVNIIISILNNYGVTSYYSKYTRNKKIVAWGMLNTSNFSWLLQYAKTLKYEFAKRYKKEHRVCVDLESIPIPPRMPLGELTDFPVEIEKQYLDMYNNKEDALLYRYLHIKNKNISHYSIKPCPKVLGMLTSKVVHTCTLDDDISYRLILTYESMLLEKYEQGAWVSVSMPDLMQKLLRSMWT